MWHKKGRSVYPVIKKSKNLVDEEDTTEKSRRRDYRNGESEKLNDEVCAAM